MFQGFLAFLAVLQVPMHQVNTVTLLSFMKYLVQNGFSSSNVANDILAVKSMCAAYGQSVQTYIHTLEEILLATYQFSQPHVSADLYLLCFSILRLSNIFPHSSIQYDISRHLARGDIIQSGCYSSKMVKNHPE